VWRRPIAGANPATGGALPSHPLLSIDGPTAARAARFLGRPVPSIPKRPWLLGRAPGLKARAESLGVSLVHAWGVEAAGVCASQLPDLPLVLTLANPESFKDAARWIRSFPTDATVVVGSQAARAILVSSGIVPERVVVIRYPADFSAINHARSENLRPSLVADASPVLLMPGPPSRSGGQYYGLWAAAIVKQVHPNLRVLLPYDSRESRRLRRFVRQIRLPDMLTIPDPELLSVPAPRLPAVGGSRRLSRLTWPELATCADLFLAPAAEETAVDSISVAMAAGLPIVASAVRSICELISDHQTGLLCKPAQPRLLAARILTALDDRDLRRRLADAARAQAYEALSPRAFIEDHHRLHENILHGRPPADGLRDPLLAA
jgi:glycosyltransferase involved in cell wall biosynthesis